MRILVLSVAAIVGGVFGCNEEKSAPPPAPVAQSVASTPAMGYADDDYKAKSCAKFEIALCPALHNRESTQQRMMQLITRINNEHAEPSDKWSDYQTSKAGARDRQTMYGQKLDFPGQLEGACPKCAEPDEILAFASTIKTETPAPGEPIRIKGRLAEVHTLQAPGWTIARLRPENGGTFIGGWFGTLFKAGDDVEVIGYNAGTCSYQGTNTRPNVPCVAAVAMIKPGSADAVLATWKKEHRTPPAW